MDFTQIAHYHQFRLTPIRREIFLILQSSDKPLSILQLMSLSPLLSQANKTTLYRDLNLFVSKDLVRVITVRSDTTFYELAALEHHHHAVCSDCQTVLDVPCQHENQKHIQIQQVDGFRITHTDIIYQGQCAQCQ